MGMYRYIYLGPYVEGTYRNETHEVETVGCTNSMCNEFHKRSPSSAKFCSACASPIGKRTRTESYQRSTYDVLAGDEDLFNFNSTRDKKKVHLGVNIKGPRTFNREEEDYVEDLTNFDRGAEIRWFEDTFPTYIERLRGAYDDVTVKWGLILYYM